MQASNSTIRILNVFILFHFLIIQNFSQIHNGIRIVAVGDMMLGTNYPDKSYLPPDSGKYLLAEAAPIIQKASLAFGNLEGCILDGEGTVKNCKDPKKCYAFRQPSYMGKWIKQAGFDVLSVANNHLGDFGQEGREFTMATLKQLGLRFAGQVSCPWDTFAIDSIRYGFTAYSVNSNTLQIHDYKLMESIVKRLDTISDIVIVSFHGGAEGLPYRYVTRKTEKYVGENRGNVYEFAHKAIDAGADLVIGHGPHVPRAIEIYNKRFIAYSLGNFCTYARFNLSSYAGIAPLLEISVNRTGEFISGQIYSFRQTGEGGPVIDPENRAFWDIKELTKHDFPGVPIEFCDEGSFCIKE
jgi:poly-gamma-glutamate capsule biosynthesis protein CapA/YwtB (metallophosphatase superfamily)